MKLGIFMGSRAVDGKEMYKDLGLTYSKGKSRGGGVWGKLFSTQSGKKANKETNNFAMSRGIPRSLVIWVSSGWMDTLTWRYPKH